MSRAFLKAFVALSVLVLSMTAPSTAMLRPDAGLVGSWEYKDGSQTITIVFDANGSGKLEGDDITYSVKVNRLVIVADGETTEYTFTLDDKGLTLQGGDLPNPVTFTRKDAKKGIGAKIKGDAPPAVESKNAGPVGTWELQAQGLSLSMVFAADGTGSVNGVPLLWKLENGDLVLTAEGTTTAYKATFTSTTFTMSGGDLNQSVTLKRVGAPSTADGHDRRQVARGERRRSRAQDGRHRPKRPRTLPLYRDGRRSLL